MKKRLCFGAKCFKKHLNKHYTSYLFSSIALFAILFGISLWGIKEGRFFDASAQGTPEVQGFLTQDFLTAPDTTDAQILAALFPTKENMTKNVYTELWDAKNYTCDWTKMTVNRLKAGDLLPTSFKAGTLTIIPAGTYSTDVPINFESCAAALGIGNVVVNSSSLEAGFNIGTNNVTIQNISFVGKGGDNLVAIKAGNVTAHGIVTKNSKTYGMNISLATNVFVSFLESFNNSAGMNIQDSTKVTVNNGKFYNNNIDGVAINGGNLNSLQNSAFFNNGSYGVTTRSTTRTLLNNVFSLNNLKSGYGFRDDTKLTLNNASVSNVGVAAFTNNNSDVKYFGNLRVSNAKTLNDGKTPLVAGIGDAVLSNGVDLTTPLMDVNYLINALNGSIFLNDTTLTSDTRIGNKAAFGGTTTRKSFYTYGNNVQLQSLLYTFDEVSKAYVSFGTDGKEFDITKTIGYANLYTPLLWNKFLDSEFWAQDPDNIALKYALFGNQATSAKSAYTSFWGDAYKCDTSKMSIVNILNQAGLEATIAKGIMSNYIYVLAAGTYDMTASLNGLSCFGFIGKGDVFIKSKAGEKILSISNSQSFILDNLRLEGGKSISNGINLTNNTYFTLHSLFLKEFISQGLRVEKSNSFLISHSQIMNIGDVGIRVKDGVEGIFDNLQVYNNKIGMYMSTNIMSITNSLFSNNDLGVSLAMANNIAMKNTVMSNHSTKGLVIDAASRTIFLDDIGFYNNKLAYSNAATDPSIKYFGTLKLVGNVEIADQNMLNAGIGDAIFADGEISDATMSKHFLVIPRDDEKFTPMLDENTTADGWIGTKSFSFNSTVSNKYGFDIPLQKELVRYVSANLVEDSIDGRHYNSMKYITETKTPLLNIKVTRVGPMVVDTLVQTISYQVNTYPVVYGLKGELEVDGATGDVTGSTGTISVRLKDGIGEKKVAMTIDKDKETATDSTSFIYNPVLAGIYKNAVEDMGDVPCTFDSVLVLKPGTDVLKQNLVSNTFYYLEEGNYLTNYQINIPSCTIIMGANDKVNLYATKAGAFGAMLSVEDKGTTLQYVSIKNISLHGESDGTTIFERCEAAGIGNAIDCNKTMICEGSPELKTEADCAKAGKTWRAALWHAISYGVQVNYATNIFLENIKASYFGININIGVSTDVSAKNIETSYADTNGMEITSAEDGMFNSISAFENIENGIYIGSSSRNTLSYLHLYKNDNGMVLNASIENRIDGGNIYNNKGDGMIMIANSDRNQANNLKIYNNTEAALYINGSNTNSINNSQFYRNGEGIAVLNSKFSVFNRIQSYSNKHVNPLPDSKCGIRFVDSTAILKDADFYNNDEDGIFIGKNSQVYYYGDLHVFGNVVKNIEDVNDGLIQGEISTDAIRCPDDQTVDNIIPGCAIRGLVGWEDGKLNETEDTISCKNVTQTSNEEGDPLFIEKECTEIGEDNRWLESKDIVHNYGTEIMKQKQTFGWETVGKAIALNKTDLARQPCKYIGDFGPFAADVCYSDLYVNKEADQTTIAAGQKGNFKLTYGNSKYGKAEDVAVVLTDLLSPGILFDTSAMAPTSIEPNYYGTYFVADDSCFKEFNDSFKGPEAELFQIFISQRFAKKGGVIPTVFEWLRDYADYKGTESDVGKYIINFCANGGSIVNESDGKTYSRPGGTFISCLETLFKNDTIHTFIPVILPQCGAYADRFLTENDACYTTLKTKSSGKYMDLVDASIKEQTAGTPDAVNTLYEYLTYDDTNDVYKAFSEFTDGKLEEAKVIPFVEDFVGKTYKVPLWFVLTSAFTDFDFGINPREFTEECGDKAGWIKVTWDLGLLEVGEEKTLSYTVKAVDKIDRLAVLNIAEIFPSFGDLDLSNNRSQRGGPVITKDIIDLGQVGTTQEEIEAYFEDKGIDSSNPVGQFDVIVVPGVATPIDMTLQNNLTDPLGLAQLYIPENSIFPTLPAECAYTIKAPKFRGPEFWPTIAGYTVTAMIELGIDCPEQEVIIPDSAIQLKLNLSTEVTDNAKLFTAPTRAPATTWKKETTEFTREEGNKKRVTLPLKHFSYYIIAVPNTPAPVTTTVTPNRSSTRLTMDICPLGDKSRSYYDLSCEDVIPVIHTSAPAGTLCNQKEYADAYAFAKENGITSASSCETARLEDYITRAEFAKMMSVFAIEIVGKKPHSNPACKKFTDISSYRDLKSYIELSCNLQMMGMKSDGVRVNETFRPSQTVLFSHLATVLSRMLFGTDYNVEGAVQGSTKWYQNHLTILKGYGIITQTSNANTTKASRGQVMLSIHKAFTRLLNR